jgi:peptidoglycan/xylan/chitin deacetylase (PgdA/CDA1 family)
VSMDRRRAIRVAAALAAGAVGASGCTARHANTPVPADTISSPPVAPPGSGSPSTGALGLVPPAEIVHGPRDRPAVALTFHGQGSAAMVQALLSRLDAGAAKVTVLAVGSWLAANRALARQILAAGHEVGNHTQNHLDIDHLPAARAYAEINTCGRLLRQVTGSIGAWFRPSQTQHAAPQVRALAARVGYPTCLSYDLDSLDYTDPSPDTLVAHVLRAVQPGSIVSMHFGHAATITAMPRILDGLRTKGLRPVTVTELVRP